MSQEKTAEFVDKCCKAIRVIDDPAELQRQLREMVEAEYPMAKPIFESGETMPMHEFLSRYQERVCKGILPDFYQRRVTISSTGSQTILIVVHNHKYEKPNIEKSAT